MSDTVEVAEGGLPRWWIWAFCLAIAAASGYWYWNGSLGASPAPLERYLLERAAALDTGEEVTRASLLELAEDERMVGAGKTAFTTRCARCHGARGEGKIGPNLTDAYWIGGGGAVDIYQTILNGRPGKGMPAWGLQLGPGACKQLAAYVITLRGRDLEGKAPEGEEWEPPPSETD